MGERTPVRMKQREGVCVREHFSRTKCCEISVDGVRVGKGVRGAEVTTTQVREQGENM